VERRHLLIIGAPRTGTTLLATMISRHTEIGVLNEDKGWSMRKLLGKALVGNKRCIPNQIEFKRPGKLHFRLWKKIGLAKEYQSSEFSIEDYLTLPHIKIIAIIRNGNDAISSGMHRGKKSLDGAAYRWCRAIEIIHELKTRFPELVLVVSFEDLVLHPRENMVRAAGFLNVEYQDRMLEGPVYNPWYPETGMNEAKVNRSKNEKVDFNLAERFPVAERHYRELLLLCQSDGKSEPILLKSVGPA
jgi:sulfotransferase family protein